MFHYDQDPYNHLPWFFRASLLYVAKCNKGYTVFLLCILWESLETLSHLQALILINLEYCLSIYPPTIGPLDVHSWSL